MKSAKNRMILVSNRLPITVKKAHAGYKIERSSGGLVSGLREIYQTEDCLWVGHCGIYSGETDYPNLKKQLADQRLITVDLSKTEYDDFYNGASNNELWPLFHYFPDAVAADANNWRAYDNVNQAFAKAVLAIAKPGDQIWVHDYQLMYLPALLRNANPELSIAYFHHIPFPAFELLRILPTGKAILTGLLGADIIGFHTHDYSRHFLNCVSRMLGCQSHLDEISYQDRRVKVIAKPLGVDVKMIKRSSDNYVEQEDVMKLAQEVGNRTVLLGIDRLDYTKGIPERLLAFQKLLERYPQYVGNITLMQICVPTRAHVPRYAELRLQVEQLVGQINGEFGAPGYIPVQYLYRAFSQEEIIAFYKLARIAIVTPLRDGLNLVCKEYVAARDDNDGVLILSETAGAAAEMGEALLINPYDLEQFIQALHTGLTMTVTERHFRLVKLRERIIEFDNIAWLNGFIQDWHAATQRNHQQALRLRHAGYTNLIKKISQASRCFIFLCELPEWKVTLQELTNNPHIHLTLMTDHSQEFCNHNLAYLPINLIAENSAYIRLQADSAWQLTGSTEEFTEIAAKLLSLLESYTQYVPGSYIEQKSLSLTWRYDVADSIFSTEQAHNLTAIIAQLLENTGVGVYNQNKILQIRPLFANKKFSMNWLLERLHFQPEDILLTIGQGHHHEEIYGLHGEQNISIHIGSANPFAKYFFNTPAEVEQFLKKICDSRNLLKQAMPSPSISEG